jgi:integrase
MSETSSLSPQQPTAFRVLMDRLGRGKHLRLVRRVFPFDSVSGIFNELHTAYLDHEHGLDSLNAQKAVLSDLRFFEMWVSMKKRHVEAWVNPTHRAAANQLPVTEREVKNFANWCQRNAASLEEEIETGDSKVFRLQGRDVVGTQFRNRRLRNASKYLQWLSTSLASADSENIEDISLVEVRRRLIDSWFEKRLLADVKAGPPRSMQAEETLIFHKVLDDKARFPDTPIGTRDRLILQLLDQGVRAGELLKLRVTDVNSAYKIDLARVIGIVKIVRNPNDIDDERKHEPSVKTRPGTLPIPRRLAASLVEYVTSPRRVAIDAREDGIETPYLFVNHHGKHVGHPLSQRNLNRLVAKLQGCQGLPQTFSPHVLRHTHLTDMYDDMRKKGRPFLDIRDALIDRGRWAPNSSMPALYTGRSLMREASEFVEDRDKKLQRG